MPSADRVDPKTNAWMEGDGTSSGRTARTTHGSSRDSGKEPVVALQSGVVQRLALSTGKDPNELAAAIPADTLRRLKFPVITQRNEDGTVTYKEHNLVIGDGRKPLLAVDRGEAGRVEAGPPRDGKGRFSK